MLKLNSAPRIARGWRAAVLGLAAASLLGACGALKPKSTEEVVAERALARWNAIVKKDGQAMHAYMRPEYRKLHTPEETQKIFGETLAKEAKVFRTTCEEARCTVRVVLNVVNPVLRTSIKTVDVVHEESWVREDGQWWFDSLVR